jgi:SAM-dependent methyltransferase
MIDLQVSKDHYDFQQYVSKERWMSYWHQLNEVIRLKPTSVLEIGAGAGIFKNIAIQFGVPVRTVDIDSDLRPDYLASVLELPFINNAFDVVACFQLLEHLPYEKSLIAIKEIARIATRYVVISLPDAKRIWRYSFHIPKLGEKNYFLKLPRLSGMDNKFDGQHYWQINNKGYPLSKIVSDFENSGLKILNTYYVPENTYQRFFIFSVSSSPPMRNPINI